MVHLLGVTPDTDFKRSKISLRGVGSRTQSLRDPELTEPETEDDSLFGDEPGVIEPLPYQGDSTQQLLPKIHNTVSLPGQLISERGIHNS
jgi:hypothetical protein